jgi:hypothetical protein
MKLTRDNHQKHPAALVAAFEQGRVCDNAGRPVTDRAVFDRLPARQMIVSEQGKAVTTPAPASCTAADSGAQARHEARKHTLSNAWKGGSK